MAYVVSGIAPTGALAGERANTYREALDKSRGWTNVNIIDAGDHEAIDHRPPTEDTTDLEQALLGLFPAGVYWRIVSSDAYGALSYRVAQVQAFDAGADARDVLNRLDDEDLGFAATRAQDPAAFLAAKVRDLT